MRHGRAYQGQHCGRPQRLDRWQANEAVQLAGAEQDLLGIRQRSPVEEGQANPIGGSSDREDGVGGTFGRGVADDKEVVVVIYELDRGRQELAHLGPAGAYETCDFGVELGDECGELLRS